MVVDSKLHVETTINVGAPRASRLHTKTISRGASLGARFNAHGPVNKRRLFPPLTPLQTDCDYGENRRVEVDGTANPLMQIRENSTRGCVSSLVISLSPSSYIYVPLSLSLFRHCNHLEWSE